MGRLRRRKQKEIYRTSKKCSEKVSSTVVPLSASSNLQSQLGNGAIQRMYQSGVLQAKLENSVFQRQSEEEEPVQKQAEEEEAVQGKLIQRQEMEEEVKQKKEEEEEPVQKMAGVAQSATVSTGGGMPKGLKSGLERLSGYDLSDVRVHYNSPKPARLKALAYTQGRNIHIAPGQERHLPHEGWHVVQQAQGRVKPTLQMAGAKINDDAGLEKEADTMGDKALSVGQRIGRGNQRKVIQHGSDYYARLRALSQKKFPSGNKYRNIVQMVSVDLHADGRVYSGTSGHNVTTDANMNSRQIGSTTFRDIYSNIVNTNPGLSWNKYNCSEPNALSKLMVDTRVKTARLPSVLASAKMDQAKLGSGDSVTSWDRNGIRKRCGWCSQWLPRGIWKKSHIDQRLVADVKSALM